MSQTIDAQLGQPEQYPEPGIRQDIDTLWNKAFREAEVCDQAGIAAFEGELWLTYHLTPTSYNAWRFKGLSSTEPSLEIIKQRPALEADGFGVKRQILSMPLTVGGATLVSEEVGYHTDNDGFVSSGEPHDIWLGNPVNEETILNTHAVVDKFMADVGLVSGYEPPAPQPRPGVIGRVISWFITLK